MIHIERKSAPSILNSAPVEDARQDATKVFSQPASERRQKHYKFFPLSTKLKGFREALTDAFDGKCAFCESYVSDDYTFMDRFRPKSDAIGLDGKSSPDHYWWLTYEWSNIYMVCFVCNKIRGQRFPVARRRAEIGVTGDELLKEEPLMLDPCADYPEEHLYFDEKGMIASDTKRGRVTIEVLGLNRSPLVQSRAEALAALKEAWQSAFVPKPKLERLTQEFFEELAHSKLPFLGMRRQFLQHWSRELVSTKPRLQKRLEPFLAFRTGFVKKAKQPSVKAEKTILRKTFERFKKYQVSQEKYSVEDDARKDSYYLKTRLIERVEIHNFKVIDDLDLAFPVDLQELGPWLLLLGENGTGKSSILHAITLALMGDRQRRKFVIDQKLTASDFVRYGCKRGHVKVHLTGMPEPIEMQFTHKTRHFIAKLKEPKVLLLGYGATRLLPREPVKPMRKNPALQVEAAKAENLFNPFTPLNDAKTWLCGLTESDFDSIARGLKELLLLDDREQLIRDCGNVHKVLVKGYRALVPLDDLSAGYQSVVALTTDIMSVMRLRWETMESAEGVVLIDEIDAHLHPRWKMQIVMRLRKAFPRLQFIVSSHDPLCLRGLHGGEVVVMKRDARGKPIAITDLPAPDSLRVDQLLTSEFFGLNSTVEPEVDELFAKYYKLLALRNPTAAQQAEIGRLKTKLDGYHQLGTTRRERIMLEATDAFLAEQDTLPHEKQRSKLKKETTDKIRELWKTAKPLEGVKS